MRKKVLLILIVIALFVSGFFLSKAFAVPLPWQLDPNERLYQSQPYSDSSKPTKPDVSGSWYSPMNPNNQPDYYWYNSPHHDGWNNAYRDWWCW